jgi:hypothetical protein
MWHSGIGSVVQTMDLHGIEIHHRGKNIITWVQTLDLCGLETNHKSKSVRENVTTLRLYEIGTKAKVTKLGLYKPLISLKRKKKCNFFVTCVKNICQEKRLGKY